MREFGPICASSTDNNSQITDNNQTNFVDAENNQSVVDNSNETEQQSNIQSSSCQQMNEQQEQQRHRTVVASDDNHGPNNVQITNLSCEKLKCIKEHQDVICCDDAIDDESIAHFASNDINMNNNRTTNLIKFNDDDNDCYNNSSCCSIVTGDSVVPGNETNQIN